VTGARGSRTAAALTAAVACAGVVGGCTTSSTPATAEQGDIATVTRVVDGDTVIVEPERGGTIRVRLIGVDTPETVKQDTAPQCFGREASARTHQLADHATVRLEFDTAVDRVDRYGRTLAYVWLPNERMLNSELLTGGYAREYDYNHQNYRYRDQFRDAQTSAQHANRGCGRSAASQRHPEWGFA